jgi:hypothetical protein
MIPNGVLGWTRTGFRDEGEHRFRDDAEHFQADPGIAFGFAGVISTRPTALDNTMASSLPRKGGSACQLGDCPFARSKKFFD